MRRMESGAVKLGSPSTGWATNKRRALEAWPVQGSGQALTVHGDAEALRHISLVSPGRGPWLRRGGDVSLCLSPVRGGLCRKVYLLTGAPVVCRNGQTKTLE